MKNVFNRINFDRFNLQDRHILLAATGCYSGYSPVAPGTAGSLVAVPLCTVMMFMPAWLNMIFVSALILFSFWICDRAAKIIGGEDPACIVLDEIAGMAVTLSGVPPDIVHIAAGFILFRIFDIIKPWPLRTLEKTFTGGAGIVADDIGAGIYASLCLNLVIMTGII